MTMPNFNAETARQYIEDFKHHFQGKIEFVDFPSGRIYLDKMTDFEAIKVANGLYDMEQEAAKGAIKQ